MVAARVGFASFVRQLRGRAGTARTIRGRGPLSSRIRLLPIAAACLLAMSVHATAEPAPPFTIPDPDLLPVHVALYNKPAAHFFPLPEHHRGPPRRSLGANVPA